MRSELDQLFEVYVKHYKNQAGGRLPVFRGQEGAGLGDFLRGMFRRVAPYIMPALSSAASSFITNASGGLSEGRTLKESMKGAIQPAMFSSLASVGERMRSQEGSGRKRRRTKSKKNKATKRRKRNKSVARVYKAPKSRKGRKKSDFITTQLPTNF